MNLLASPLPASVRIGGAEVPIRTGYRTGIQVARVAESGLPQVAIAAAVLRLYFPGQTLPDPAQAIDAALSFHRCDKPQPQRTSSERLFDWDHDAARVLSDFRREYAIDLADPGTRMHWWVFMALFENLGAESATMTAMAYRGPKPKELKGDDARRWARAAKAVALPPRTAAEAIARDAALWGE
jgi:hypothetical protein